MSEELSEVVKNYILFDSECEGVHKFVWPDRAFISSIAGRTKITAKHSLAEVKQIVCTHKGASLCRDIEMVLDENKSVLAASILNAPKNMNEPSTVIELIKFLKSCAKDNWRMVEKAIGKQLLNEVMEFKLPK